jgi:phage-related protein
MKQRCTFFSKSMESLALLVFASFLLATSVSAQSTPQPNAGDITRQDVASFNSFLEAHIDIADELRKDPSLVDNRDYVAAHPALQEFLREHPGVDKEITQSPNAFMHQEDKRENIDTRRELANFDQFLDTHPELAEQLRKDPRLADNKEFVDNHPALQQFLQEHPGVRDQLAQDPGVFMHEEDRYDQRGDDATRRELANFDHFLDSHPEIAEQLRKDPRLADNKQFVDSHPALQQFLQEHAGVREQLAQDPRVFMHEEDRFDQHQGWDGNRDRDMSHGDFASMSHFLDSHPEISQQLIKNPQLATNDEYLANHPEFQDYLKNNPGVKQELAENPESFMQSVQNQKFNNNGANQKMGTEQVPKPKTMGTSGGGSSSSTQNPKQ